MFRARNTTKQLQNLKPLYVLAVSNARNLSCDGVQKNAKFMFEVGFDTTALHICVTIEPDKNKFM